MIDVQLGEETFACRGSMLAYWSGVSGRSGTAESAVWLQTVSVPSGYEATLARQLNVFIRAFVAFGTLQLAWYVHDEASHAVESPLLMQSQFAGKGGESVSKYPRLSVSVGSAVNRAPAFTEVVTEGGERSMIVLLHPGIPAAGAHPGIQFQ
jgi:hypothetical protein